METYLIIGGLLVIGYLVARKPKGAPYQVGVASWYGPGLYGNKTANGEVFTGEDLTAAHLKLKFGTRVQVTRLDTGASVVVRINDRGPYVPPRIIDLSERAAEVLGMKEKGLAEVRLDIVG